METRENKKILSDAIAELAETVLKNNIYLNLIKKLSNKIVEALLEPSLPPPYAILYMTDLEEKLLEIFLKKQ